MFLLLCIFKYACMKFTQYMLIGTMHEIFLAICYDYPATLEIFPRSVFLLLGLLASYRDKI